MIKLSLAAAAVFALTACATPALASPEEAAVTPPVQSDGVQVMILGTYHFDNPGLDLVNVAADDVLAERRQSELKLVAERLTAFQPTAVAVEKVPRGGSLIDPGFARFTEADLTSDRNEIVQIGYRIAHQQGIDRVYAVDAQDGEIEFFPFDRAQSFAEKTGQMDLVNGKIAQIQAEVEAIADDREATPMYELLARENDIERTQRMHSNFYYGLLKLADAEEQPGAALNYGWYARNALIFANIAASSQPGDRILVIYGSGHNYWLQHFAETTPGFQFVDPVPYLTGQATASTAANGS
ncbi:MAG: hypothetical protein B7X53_10950 [Hyphomonas sp. 34-62-18]|nr:DUF5694 domain-containing protein [Hyphomonas sp. 34-62-18]OZB15653.1 MAG: hypothetical protein B7X53_10950 [Hyphomonas sp. 34-62-18]